jgi:hypothetical protein
VGPASLYAEKRDIPDVVGMADYRAATDETLVLIQERVRSGSLGKQKAMFPLVKTNPAEIRKLTVLDPLDDLALRVYVGRCSPAIVRATDRQHVLNGVIDNPGPGWFTASHREQGRIRRQLQKGYLDRYTTRAVGFFDVKNFFPSCDHEIAGRLLLDAGAPPGAVERILEALDRMYRGSGRGLPIGFEGSGPMANLFLRPMDNALEASGRPYIRWTDDVEVYVGNRSEWAMIAEAAEVAVRSVKLQFNLDKTVALPTGGPAEARIFDPARDSIFAADDPAAEIVDELVWEAMWSEWGMTGDMPPARFRSYIGRLKADRDPGALAFLTAYPYWILREPRAVGDYLIDLVRHDPTKGLVDRDWLIELATDPAVGDATAAGQLHLCRVLSHIPLSHGDGETLLNFATDFRRMNRYCELSAWATRGWARSSGWDASDALDLVTACAMRPVQRAAIAGFLHKAPGKKSAKWLRDRAERNRELAPMVHLVTTS